MPPPYKRYPYHRYKCQEPIWRNRLGSNRERHTALYRGKVQNKKSFWSIVFRCYTVAAKANRKDRCDFPVKESRVLQLVLSF